MTLLPFHTSLSIPLTHSPQFLHLVCSFKHKTLTSSNPKPLTTPPTIQATDRLIGFGKYKGKMLGTLPSSYLKWVSGNLRSRDFEEWAKLADQVLQDPVYNDRIEWEFAQNLLNGNNNSPSRIENPVSELVEISERFGWDNKDKVGWSRVNFELLGTSKGGRIPRVEKNRTKQRKTEEKDVVLSELGGGGRRKERRERLRPKREEVVMEEDKLGIKEKAVGTFENEVDGNRYTNPFPGREALLKKVLYRKKSLKTRLYSQ